MSGPLWRREWRGGIRSVVRQPWMVPVALAIWAVVCRLAHLEYPPGGAPPGVNYWPPSGLIGIWLPQGLLVLAMVGIVSWRVVCDRGNQELAASLLSPREIILAKTLAPTALSIAVIVGLAWREALDASAGVDAMILWRLGCTTWYGGTFGSTGFDPGALGYLLLKLALPFRALLLALVIVTMTAWLSARFRRPGRAMLASLALIGAATGSVFAAEALLWHQFGNMPPIMLSRSFQGLDVNFALLRHHDEFEPYVVREAIIVVTTRIVLPMLWLVYWWRGTGRRLGKRISAKTMERMAMNEHMLMSVQIGKPRTHETPRGPWRTAFFKEPVGGQVMLGRIGIEGDGVADTRYHGGPENAVCVYSADHFAAWRADLPQLEPGPGAFGENFTVEGVTEEDVCIGDVFAVGGVHVQISKPRQPCSAIARRWNVKDFVERVQQTARTGWYLRVLDEGVVEAPTPLRLVERPCPEWPVAHAFRVFMRRREDRESARALAACELLAPNWREQLMR